MLKISFALSNFELNSRILKTDQENLPFQIKDKQKWTPKYTNHNVSTFIDLIQNDLNEEKT